MQSCCHGQRGVGAGGVVMVHDDDDDDGIMTQIKRKEPFHLNSHGGLRPRLSSSTLSLPP